MNKSIYFAVGFSALLQLTPAGSQAELFSSIRIRVWSSANYVYPCNAGIAQNPRAVNKGVDFIRGSWQPSQHMPSAPAGEGVAIGGSTQSNNPDPDFATLSALLGGSRPYLAYNQLLPEDTQYNFVIGQNPLRTQVEINLTSDTYDAGYYITFCFKPSQIPNPENVPMQLNFVSARATHAVVPGAPYNYATDSGLRSMVEVKCTQDAGRIVQHYTPNGATSIDALLTPFSGNVTVDMAPAGGIQIGGGASQISGPALPFGVLPDECRVRFYFIETAGRLRPHTLTSSDIQLDLEATVGTP